MNARAILQAGASGAGRDGCEGWAQCPRLSAAGVRAQARGPGKAAVALAVVLSLSLHLSAMAALAPRDQVLIEGGVSAAQEAALGNSFADFAEGAVPVAPSAEPARPVPAEPLTPTQTPVTPAPAATPPVALSAEALEGSEAVLPISPEAAPATPPEMATPEITAPAPPAAPSPPVAAAQPPAPMLEPLPEVVAQTATAETPRPRPRAAPQPAGNAPQSARRGSAEGSERARGAETTSGASASAPGNAAVSNYPGEVMRRIQRTRQQRTSARGRAVVSFTVGADGALASVGVQRSSGSAELDRIAQDHIRRAAPFPPPPAGAQRAFSFEFVGR